MIINDYNDWIFVRGVLVIDLYFICMREIFFYVVCRIKNLWIFKGNVFIFINFIFGDISMRLKMYKVFFCLSLWIIYEKGILMIWFLLFLVFSLYLGMNC